MCIITDWQPGALVFQSYNVDIPMMRLVYSDEYTKFMNEVGPIFNTDYPEIPVDKIG